MTPPWRRLLGAPAWCRPTLLALVAATAWGYARGADDEALELYYAATVRSMATDGHNFVYGAFDPNGTISLDKLPGALWLQAAAVHLFGLHTWAMVLPQIVEGALTIAMLFAAVRLVAGPVAAIVAAAAMAVAPVVVSLDRGNISDTLMILLLVLAAHATTKALTTGHARWLLLAGAWVGLAFQAKMVQAWLVLPAIAVAYLAFAAPSWWRRVGAVAAMGGLCLAVSLSWMTFVSLHPADQRPYVDGSQSDSVFEQVFVYNALGRVGTGAEPGVGDAPGLSFSGDPRAFVHAFTADVPAGPTRLLADRQGRDIGWLIPLALAAAAWLLVESRSRPRADPRRAAVLLWAVWLVTFVIALSAASYINPYYGAVLAPPVAALVGMGAGRLWACRAELSTATWIGAGAAVTATVAYAIWLLAGGWDVPGWAPAAVLALGAAALVTVGLAAVTRRPALAGGALVAIALAVLAAPTVASADQAATSRSPFDTPFQAPDVTEQTQVVPRAVLEQPQTGIDLLRKLDKGSTYLFATDSAIVAAPIVYQTGDEVLPIGGFSGQAPAPTLDELRRDVDQGQLHFALLPPPSPQEDDRRQWIRHACAALPATKDGADLAAATHAAVLTVYLCAPATTTPTPTPTSAPAPG